MQISLAITDFILVALALQGLVMAFLLIWSAKKIKSNGWVGAFIFVVAESLLMLEVDRSGFLMKHSWLFLFTFQFRMTLGPLIYFYTRSLLGEKTLIRDTWTHFLPVLVDLQRQIIFLLYISGILALPFVERIYFTPAIQNFSFIPGIWNNFPALISFSIYAGLSYKLFNAHLEQKDVSTYKLADLKWLKTLLHIVFGLSVVWLVSLILNYDSFAVDNIAWKMYILYVPAIVFIYWLGMVTYIRHSKMSAADVVEYNKASKVYFTPAEAKKYEQHLVLLMETGIYLDALLKLDTLAVKLSLSERAFSNLLNQHLGKNFNDFVNEYRVKEAMKKLTSPAYRQFTIALDCGFNSLATFQRCFKQFTGITPSQYQNSLKPVGITGK